MAFRSLYAFLTAAVLGSASLAKAEPPLPLLLRNSQEVSLPSSTLSSTLSSKQLPSLTSSSSLSLSSLSSSGPLDFRLQLPALPQITLEHLNRCPPSFSEILQPPRLVTELAEGHPLREIVLDAFGGETSKDPEYDGLRSEILEQIPPLCLRTGALDPPKRETLEEKLSFFPEEQEGKQTAGSSFTEIQLELPGGLHYVVLGRHRNTVYFGELYYNLSDKKIELYPGNDSLPRTWSLPQPALESITIGSLNLPAFLSNLNQYRPAVKELGNSIEQFTAAILEKLQLTDERGQVTARGVELSLKLRGVFEEILPQYVANDGVIDPDEWSKIKAAVSEKISEFRNQELTETEEQELDKALNNFEARFYQLQERFPAIRNIWTIYQSDDPLSRVSLGNISLRTIGDWLEAFDPKLYTLQVEQNRISFHTNSLNSALDGRSSNFHELNYGNGRRFVETNAGRVQMQASGSLELHALLSGGSDIQDLLDQKYRDDFELIKLILAIDPQLIDIDLNAKAVINFYLKAERKQGFLSETARGKYNFGIEISFGQIYTNNAQGDASLAGKADSQADLLRLDFRGKLNIAQSLGYQEEIGLFLFSSQEKYWFDARVNALLEQRFLQTEAWTAALSHKANYRGETSQYDWSYDYFKGLRWINSKNFGGSFRGGVNLEPVDFFVFSNFKEAGAGMFLNTKLVNVLAECHFPSYCQVGTRIALHEFLDTRKTREHFLAQQRMAYSTLAGIESLRTAERHRYNLITPGCFLDLELSQTFANIFPYYNSANIQLGLAALDPFNMASIDLYLTAKYDGNFTDAHGFVFNLGSKYWESFFGLKFSTNESRNSNSAYGTSGLTLHLGKTDLAVRFELYPDPLDQQPEYKETIKKDPLTNQEFKTYEKKRRGDFRILTEIRASPELLDQLAAAIPPPSVSLLQLSASKGLKSVEDWSMKATLQFNFGNLNLYNAIQPSLSKTEGATIGLEMEALYLVGSSGLGPSVIASKRFGSQDESYKFLPGIGFQTSSRGLHDLKALVSGFYDHGLVSDLLVKYRYDDRQKTISPYLQLEASLFSRLNSQGLENLHSYANLTFGLRAGPLMILPVGGGFKTDRKRPEFVADAGLGLDLAYFIRK